MSYLGPSLRRKRRRSRPWIRGTTAVAVALLANAVALRAIRVDDIIGASKKGPVPRPVALAPLSAAEWESNRQASQGPVPRRASPQPLAAVPPPPPPPNKMKGQVVDVPPSKNATPPKDSRFLAEHNSTVEKETRSRHARPGYDNALSKPSSPAAERSNGAAERERLASGGEGGGGGKAAGSGGRGGTKAGSARVPHQANRDKLALKVDPRGEMRLRDPWQGARGKIDSPDVPGRSGQGREGQAEAPVEGAPGQPQLRPSAASYDRLAGGPAPDRLDGVDEGEGTFLNTREWKYSSYFNRIKQAVATHWDPGNALLKRDPTGQRYAYKDRVTLVTVTLDEAGTLKDVHVQRSSGVDFLDMTAMEAFRKAQPFANPPRGLADEHGEIGFVFGFYLEVGSGFRIFRGPASP